MRASAMRLLAKSGSPEAASLVLKNLEDEKLGGAAVESVGYVADAEQSILPRLIRGLTSRCLRRLDPPSSARLYCSNALGALRYFGARADSAAPVVVAILKAQPVDDRLHDAAITAAGRIGPAAAGAVPFMIAGLRHHDGYVNQEAIEALKRVGPAAKAAVPALHELRKAQPYRADAVAAALAAIEGAPAPGSAPR